ncbi:MAG: YtpR family tRNA-binding protein [Sporolactobacillus sp.]
MILYYNKQGIGDVLLVYIGDAAATACSRQEDVARLYDAATNQTVGYNFFALSKSCELSEGQVSLTAELLSVLNSKIKAAGFTDQLTDNGKPLIVTGFVQAMKTHPDSDHMHICTVDVGDAALQIVCGAPNIDQGQHVVVARIGALMPDGQIIRPTVLRGVDSEGMICSARELALPNAPKRRGILVLNADTAPGQDFFAMHALRA